MTARLSLTGKRVGHAAHRGEAARRGRARAAGDRLLVLVAGLAQVDVDVDQPGAHHLARRVHRLASPAGALSPRPSLAMRPSVTRTSWTASTPLAGSSDAAVLDEQAHARLAPGEEDRAPPCGRRRRWSPGRGSPSTGRRPPRATSSTPRFTGPGCMISTSGRQCCEAREGQPPHARVLADGRDEAALSSARAAGAAS